MKKDRMVFWRVFDYVWPQWPRLVLVVSSALLAAILFSLSFMTIIPLLKVMMGEEGLHGWIDRKTCDVHYGMDFYVPDISDLTSEEGSSLAYYLRVTDVDPNGVAEYSGISKDDQIIYSSREKIAVDDMVMQASSSILEVLATSTEQENFYVVIRRFDSEGKLSEPQVRELFPGTGEANFGDGLKLSVIGIGKKLVSFLPRNQAKENKRHAVVLVIILMGIVTIFRCIARFIQTYYAEKVVQVAIAGVRENMFAHVMTMPVGFFSVKGGSDTISRIVGDTAGTGKGIKVLLGKALREPLKALLTLACAMAISWKLSLIFLGAAPMIVGFIAIFGNKIKKATKKSLVSSARMLGRVQGAINAVSVVKVYNRQDHEVGNYITLNRRYIRQILRVAKAQSATGPTMEVLGMLAMSGALVLGAHWVFSGTDGMMPSSFFTLLVLLGTSAESIRKASDVWNKVQSANAAAERVFEVIDSPPEAERADAFELKELEHQIGFNDVTFTYPGSEVVTLKKVNLTVNAGETVAVVGPNGSGKTTLVNLLARFYDLDSGTIVVDGQDIRDCSLKSLRSQIGMVTQKVVTFNDTIAANISYGRPDATMDEIINAAKRSFCHEFIAPLPDGYNTLIGENSAGFSGGQLQRIVIARAILKDPAILIFDEAMSQVDAHSESLIHDALSELVRDRTCFVIAHRFSTVISADRIVVMEDGEIVASGKHNELLAECELYQRLYETQLSN